MDAGLGSLTTVMCRISHAGIHPISEAQIEEGGQKLDQWSAQCTALHSALKPELGDLVAENESTSRAVSGSIACASLDVDSQCLYLDREDILVAMCVDARTAPSLVG